MSIAEIRRLPLHQRLQIMEAIWEDLRAQAETVTMPEWHEDLLDQRRQAVREGRERILDWDEAKALLGGPRG